MKLYRHLRIAQVNLKLLFEIAQTGVHQHCYIALEIQNRSLSARVRELKPIIETEEATKTTLIIPFISNVLGYDVTDPREVIPEYTADVGVKKGEKVDFAIKTGDDFHFLIECKRSAPHSASITLTSSSAISMSQTPNLPFSPTEKSTNSMDNSMQPTAWMQNHS